MVREHPLRTNARRPLQVDAATKTELIEVLDRFCSAFADRDAEAVMRLFTPDPGVSGGSSPSSGIEKALLRQSLTSRALTQGLARPKHAQLPKDGANAS